METITLSKQAQERVAAALMAPAQPNEAMQRAAAQHAQLVRATPPLCLGCGARNHPDDHGALPCGH